MTVRRTRRTELGLRLRHPWPPLRPLAIISLRQPPYSMSVSAANAAEPDDRPYPLDWEDVAELRVFRTTEERWQRLIGWRAEMQRKGWKLLRVSADGGEMVAVFGRTKDELLSRLG